MTAISIVTAGTRNGKEMVRATILSSTVPSPLPTNGANVVGMTEDQVFAPMSIMYITSNAAHKVYIANEQGTFVAQ